MIVLVILLVVIVGVLAFLLFREKQGAATEKQDPAKLVPKGILDRGGVGPVLAVTNDNKVLFFNKDFAQLFPEIATAETISAYPEMMRLFKDEEYVSEVLSRIYEIRYETLEQENVQGKFV